MKTVNFGRMTLPSYVAYKLMNSTRYTAHNELDLIKYSASELLRIPNFGKRSLYEVELQLMLLGLKLKNSSNNPDPSPEESFEGRSLFIAYMKARTEWYVYRHEYIKNVNAR